MKKLFIFFVALSSLSLAQSFEYSESIGNFKSATSFYITANGLIYVTDKGSNEAFLLDTLGNEMKSFGGYGWGDNSFDDPADVFADPLTVYVADKNNHRIKRFDKNLNFISSLYTRDSDDSRESFGYPLSCATSNQGDLYLIDSENKRAMKFDFNGNFKQDFGGFDAGNFMLSNPKQLAIASNNNIFIIDEDKIIVFDQYGNGIVKINCEVKLNGIRILFDQLTATAEKKILYSNLRLPEAQLSVLTLLGVDEIPELVSSMLFNNKLYILSKNSILVFRKDNNN
ncbi:MAG TPA: NHL repeat-containing protein [Ignavibacteriaceae bacterium]|nr:NHL repeat-containing protein [Ignavibacteriaceae bacterium]